MHGCNNSACQTASEGGCRRKICRVRPWICLYTELRCFLMQTDRFWFAHFLWKWQLLSDTLVTCSILLVKLSSGGETFGLTYSAIFWWMMNQYRLDIFLLLHEYIKFDDVQTELSVLWFSLWFCVFEPFNHKVRFSPILGIHPKCAACEVQIHEFLAFLYVGFCGEIRDILVAALK